MQTIIDIKKNGFKIDEDMVRGLAYLTVLASLTGGDEISVNLGLVNLSVFRLSIFLLGAAIFTVAVRKSWRISFKGIGENRYSIRFMIIWLAYAAVSVIWVKDYVAWAKAVFFIGLGTLCAVAFCNIFRRTSEILACFKAMSVMIVLHNLLGWYESATGHYMFLAGDKIKKYVIYHYPVSTFTNTNDFGTFMFVSVVILCICIANSKGRVRYIYAAALVSSAILLVKTNSRANILGLIIAGFAYAILAVRKAGLGNTVSNIRAWFGRQSVITKLKNRFWEIAAVRRLEGRIGRRNTIIAVAASFAAVILMIMLATGTLGSIGQMIGKKLNFNFTAGKGSDSERMNLIKNGFSFLISTFGFGTGAGNVEYWMINYGIYDTAGTANMHNWWMEILTGYGVIIFALYLVFYFRLLRSMYRRYMKSTDKREKAISLGIMCCMAGFVLGSTSSSTNINKEWLWVFWAVCIAYQGIYKKMEINTDDKN